MQLSLRADYALRVLLYLGAHPREIVSTQRMSEAYGISKNHLVRVLQTLGEHGYVNLRKGRAGGVSLAIDPRDIRLGEVVRAAEPNLRIVECFDARANTCAITPVCTLRPVLNEALNSFLATLNRYTLADLLARGAQAKLANVFATIAVL